MNGSIPHKLVEMALERHQVPSSIKILIMDYYSNFNLKFTLAKLDLGGTIWKRGLLLDVVCQ